jgi:hypothetical protein
VLISRASKFNVQLQLFFHLHVESTTPRSFLVSSSTVDHPLVPLSHKQDLPHATSRTASRDPTLEWKEADGRPGEGTSLGPMGPVSRSLSFFLSFCCTLILCYRTQTSHNALPPRRARARSSVLPCLPAKPSNPTARPYAMRQCAHFPTTFRIPRVVGTPDNRAPLLPPY